MTTRAAPTSAALAAIAAVTLLAVGVGPRAAHAQAPVSWSIPTTPIFATNRGLAASIAFQLLSYEDVGLDAPTTSNFDQIHAAVSTPAGVFGAAPTISNTPPAILLDTLAVGPDGQLDVAWESGTGLYVAGASNG